MNMDRLTELLEAYGADPARWPESERPAALALLAAAPAAREMQREIAALDQLLAQAPTIQPDSGLHARILRQLPPVTQRFDVWAALGRLLPLRAAMPQMAVLAIALTLGISAGLGDLETIFGAEDSASLAVQWVVADSGFLTE